MFACGVPEFRAQKRVPVHYPRISSGGPANEGPADESVCWVGEMTFPGHVFRLRQLPGFGASLVFGPEPIVAGDRRVLATQLWSAVSAQLQAYRIHQALACALSERNNRLDSIRL